MCMRDERIPVKETKQISDYLLSFINYLLV